MGLLSSWQHRGGVRGLLLPFSLEDCDQQEHSRYSSLHTQTTRYQSSFSLYPDAFSIDLS